MSHREVNARNPDFDMMRADAVVESAGNSALRTLENQPDFFATRQDI